MGLKMVFRSDVVHYLRQKDVKLPAGKRGRRMSVLALRLTPRLADISRRMTQPKTVKGGVRRGGVSVKDRMYNTEGVKSVEVEIVWTPPWNPAEMASDAVKDRLGIW